MKKRILTLAAITLGVLAFQSCKGNSEQDKTADGTEQTEKKSNEELKAYMLAGIYTINGYGGISTVESQIGDRDETDSYMQLLAFPFQIGQPGVKQTLSNSWDINSKEDLTKRLGELLNNDKSKFKAWDYARLANNVNMGYAAEYLTKEEGKEWLDKALKKAEADFKTWADYHKNFIEGRKDWSPDVDSDYKAYDDLSKNISNMSVYKNNPLN